VTAYEKRVNSSVEGSRSRGKRGQDKGVDLGSPRKKGRAKVWLLPLERCGTKTSARGEEVEVDPFRVLLGERMRKEKGSDVEESALLPSSRFNQVSRAPEIRTNFKLISLCRNSRLYTYAMLRFGFPR